MSHVVIIPTINYASLLLAAVVTFMLGWVWYSFLFGRVWMKYSGVKCDKKPKLQQMIVTLLSGFGLNLLKLWVLQFVLIGMHAVTIGIAANVAVLVWLGFIATCAFAPVLWEKRPVQLYLINIGLELCTLLIAAVIFVGW